MDFVCGPVYEFDEVAHDVIGIHDLVFLCQVFARFGAFDADQGAVFAVWVGEWSQVMGTHAVLVAVADCNCWFASETHGPFGGETLDFFQLFALEAGSFHTKQNTPPAGKFP